MSWISDAIDELRALGVPEASIPGVLELLDGVYENARRSPRVRQHLAPEETRNGVSNADWQELREQTFVRDGFACVYCGSDGDGRSLHADHVTPRSRGGASSLENLAASCWRCNLSKKDRTPQEWDRR